MTDNMVQFERHVAAVDRHEPVVQALVGWDEATARHHAEHAGEGLLSGWALGVKDIIDVRGMPTACGVDFLPDTPAARSAPVVERLEELGAYVLAKTVTTAFAFLDPGPTTNPWNAAPTPGGSSSGSGAAVAAGMARLALGSQTIASVARPASFCGVAGYKPTYERMSREGVFPFSSSVDTVGFFTAGAADMLTAGAAFFDEYRPLAPLEPRIAVIEDLYCPPADQEMLGAVRRAADKLRAGGFDVQPAALPEAFRDAYKNHLQLVSAEVAHAHRRTYEQYQAHYAPKLRGVILKGQGISAEQLAGCLKHRAELQVELDGLFDRFDLLLTPSAPGAAPRGLDTTGDPRMSLVFTHTGVPSLTLPAELSPAGLPLGVQIVARKNQDMYLLVAGMQIEKALAFDAPLPGS